MLADICSYMWPKKEAIDIKSSCTFPKPVIMLNVIADDCSPLQTPEHDVITNEGWLGGMKMHVHNELIAADPLFILIQAF